MSDTGMRILAGSKGNYVKVIPGYTPKSAGFTVTHDTPTNSDKISIKFDDAAEGCVVPMRDVNFTVKKLKRI